MQYITKGLKIMTDGFVYQEIGRRIRALRGPERQKDWASKIGCDQGYISQVENGVTKPSLAFLRGVVSITGASIDWMLTGRGQRLGGADPYGLVPDLGTGAGAHHKDDVLSALAGSPRLLQGVSRLLQMEDTGKGLLEALGDMDERQVAGLAEFMGIPRKG